jgi:hypothetical protein
MDPSLQQAAKSLELQLRRANVGKTLSARPTAQELQQANILSPLSSPGGLAPSLAAAAASLEHQMTADKLARHLRERPTQDKLERVMSASVA